MSDGVIAALIGAAATIVAAVIAARATGSRARDRASGATPKEPELDNGTSVGQPAPPPHPFPTNDPSGTPAASPRLKWFEATVRGEGHAHHEGHERLYVAVNKSAAEGFPYREGERVPIKFEVNGTIYEAGVRTTPAQTIVYIASDVQMPGSGKVTLASVLEAAGVQKGDRVTLGVVGKDVQLSRGTESFPARHFPGSLPVNKAVAEPDLAAEVQSMLSQLRKADGPAAIVIGHSRRPPRVQVFAGSCTEADVAAVRQALKAHDPQYQVSIVQDPTQYSQYRTATLDNPSGSI